MFRSLLLIFLTTSWVNGQEWSVKSIASGVKPDVVVDSKGQVHIGFLSEAVQGFLAHADLSDTANIRIDTIEKSYYYGPMAMAINADDRIALAVHDHITENEKVCQQTATGRWDCVNIEDFGHDGWDNHLVFDNEGNLYTSSIDPSTGVEFSWRINNVWNRASLPTARFTYGHGTTVALDSTGRVHIAYHDPEAKTLMFARQNGPSWQIEEIASGTGTFPHMGINKRGEIHIVFTTAMSITAHIVHHAVFANNHWVFSNIDTLSDGSSRMIRMVTIDFDAEQRPSVVYSDRKLLKHAILDKGVWQRDIAIDYRLVQRFLGASVGHTTTEEAIHIATYTSRDEILYVSKKLGQVPTPSPDKLITGVITNTRDLPMINVRVEDRTTGNITMSDNQGRFTLSTNLNQAELVFSKEDEPSRGVTVSDLIAISNHILDIRPFTEDLQFRAADVNDSGSITASDLVVVRNVILGRTLNWPSGQSWIFDQQNIKLVNSELTDPIIIKAWKYGDANNSVNPNE